MAQEEEAPTWVALCGGADAEEMEGVWATADDGFIVAGITDSYGDRRGEAWLLRLAADGSIVWQKTYGGRRDDMLIDVRETEDGGFVAAGWTESFGVRRTDMWVVKLDADGDIEWQRAYGGRRNDGGGGTYGEFVVRVLEDEGGNFVVASDTFSFGHGHSDIWVLKLDPDGEIVWQRAYGGNDEETVWAIQEAADGEVMWRSEFEYGWDWPNAIQELPDGGHVVAGVAWPADEELPEDLLVMRLDAQGGVGRECAVLSGATVTPRDTRSSPRRTRARVTVTDVVPRDASARVRDSDAVPDYLCRGATGGSSTGLLGLVAGSVACWP